MCAAAYGSNATVAKTEEELEDRHQSLYGDADSADDIKISMPSNDISNGAHGNGDAASKRQIPAQVQSASDSAHPLRVSLHFRSVIAWSSLRLSGCLSCTVRLNSLHC